VVVTAAVVVVDVVVVCTVVLADVGSASDTVAVIELPVEVAVLWASSEVPHDAATSASTIETVATLSIHRVFVIVLKSSSWHVLLSLSHWKLSLHLTQEG